MAEHRSTLGTIAREGRKLRVLGALGAVLAELELPSELEAQQRAAVLEEAATWLGTPHIHGQRVKGAGVDCANFPAAVYHAAGVVAEIPRHPYTFQWHLHNDRELWLEEVVKYARELAGAPLPADLVLFRFGRVFSHGAIVVAWPLVVEARADAGRVIYSDASRDGALARLAGKPRPRKFFTMWGG